MTKSAILLATLSLLLPTAPAVAVAPRSWTVESARDFLAGEAEGIRMEADGGIAPALERIELARIAGEAIALSVARAPGGDLWVGTGFAGGIYRIPARGGAAERVARLPGGGGVFALAVGSAGEVYAAASPGGKVFRVDPKGTRNGEPVLVFDSGERYVWAIAVEKGGKLLVATGDAGKLFRVSASLGKGEVRPILDSAEPNIRSLAVGGDGTIWCGTDGHSLVYRIAPGGSPAVVADSGKTEISSLLPASDGSVLVLATTGDGALQPPPSPAPRPAAGSAGGGSAPGGEVSQGSVSVSVSVDTSFAAPTGTPPRSSFELFRVRRDGMVEPVAGVDDEIGYALVDGPDGRPWVATGPKGRIYRVEGRALLLARDLPEKNAVALVAGGRGELLALSADGPSLHRIGPGTSPIAKWTSPVHAEERFNRWGAWRAQLARRGGAAPVFSFRSGSSPLPDETWSPWTVSSGDEGSVPAPPSRYVQWRAAFATEGGEGAILRSLVVRSVPGNLPPTIESVVVHDPGAIFVRGTYGSGNVVVEAGNPDEKGMFNVVGEAKERGELGKKMFRKGFRTVSWKAADPNDDSLVAEVSVRPSDPAGEPRGEWIVAGHDLTEPVFSFDASALPDGWWQFRVRVSDRGGNAAGEGLEAERTSGPIVVDGTPPVVRVEQVTAEGNRVRIRVRVEDELSSLLRAERSIDGGDWVAVRPVDGATDSRVETFEFEAEGEKGAPKLVVFRVLDSSYNVATKTCHSTTDAGRSGRR